MVPAIFRGAVLLGCSFAALAAAQNISKTNPSAAATASVLQRRYDAAQHFQAAHDPVHAAEQYHIFLADALGQIGLGEAHAGAFDQAAGNFDEALTLVPDFPAMRLEYARAALQAGHLERAKLLATETLQQASGKPQVAAGAHAVLGRVLLKLDRETDAKAEFNQAVALDPTFENGYELAVAELDLGDAEGANKLFAEMLASYGDKAVLHLYFGQAYGTSDLQARSMEEFKRAEAEDSHLPGLHYSIAAAYLASSDSNKEAEAIAELRQEIAVAPGNAAAYAALGHLLSGETAAPAQQAEAEQDLKHATELAPADPDAFFYLGQMYAHSGREVEAQTALRQSIALTTDPSRNGFQVQKAHYLLGRLLLKAGNAEDGKREIAISQTLNQQGLNRDEHRMQQYLAENDTVKDAQASVPMPVTVGSQPIDAEAAKQAKALETTLGPAIADSYNNLGALAGAAGQYRSAEALFAKAYQWNPRMAGLDYNWGRAAFAAGDAAGAVAPLSRYVREHADDQGARSVLGLSEFSAGQYAAARDTLKTLAANPGAAPQLRFAYADSLVRTGDMGAGVAQLEALEAADPKVEEVHRELGEAYAASKPPAARHELESALELNPADTEAHLALARLQVQQGDAPAAVTQLQAALRLQPGDTRLQTELAAASRASGQKHP